MSDSKTVELAELHRNDYNPRKDAESGIGSLKESIEKEGLIQALTVRPNDHGYEVISGERRLSALRELYGDEHDVAVTIRDVDDETARRLALAENLERKDLTPIEEAWGFARVISWCETCGHSVPSDHPKETYHEVMSYANMVSDRTLTTIPGADSKATTEAATTHFAGVSKSYIRDRLALITLPEDIQEAVDTGDLPKRAARMLARIDIDEPEPRAKAITRIVGKFSGGLSNDDYDRLDRSIESEEQIYEERQGLKGEELDDQRQLVENREQDTLSELSDAVSFAREAFGATFNFEDLNQDVSGSAVDDIYSEMESTLRSRKHELSEVANKAGSKGNDLSKRAARLDQGVSIVRQEPGFDDDRPLEDFLEVKKTVNSKLEQADSEQSAALQERKQVSEHLDTIDYEYNRLEQARGELDELRDVVCEGENE